MLELALSLLGLLLGPAAYLASRRREELYGFLDGFVLVGVAGLILAEVIPATVRSAGLLAVGLALAGFVLPFALERQLALLPFSPNVFFRWLMVLGLLLHQLLDGVALSGPMRESGTGSLRLAVVLHQIPKGFFIWGMVGAAMGGRLRTVMMGSLVLVTIAGYGLGDRVLSLLPEKPLSLFQAFIGGGLLHVIAHHVPRGLAARDACCPTEAGGEEEARRAYGPRPFWGGLGALISLIGLVVLAVAGEGAHHGGEGEEGKFAAAFLHLAVESAPWILLGLIAAGVFQAFLPRFIFSGMRKRGIVSQALQGIAIGIPLPLCSCGVVPVYLSLLRKSVPPAAALAFLIATPEIGIDSIFLSGKLLGLEITLIRLAFAFLIALAVGLSLARAFERIERSGDLERMALPEDRPLPPTFRGKLREALRFGGREIVDHTGAWLLVGIALAAALDPSDTEKWFEGVPMGVDVLLASLLGLPLYVCASGATPLAAVLLQKGVSTGAVLAFLITGPATNITTFGILKRYHGLKGAFLFAGAVYGFSIAIGFGINAVFPTAQVSLEAVLAEGAHGILEWTCAAALAALFADSVLRLGPRGFLSSLSESFRGPPEGRLRPGDGHDHHHHHHHHPVSGPAH